MSGIGRNDPCPCGSGRKYKKCCLAASGLAPGAYTKAESQSAWAALGAFTSRAEFAGDRAVAEASFFGPLAHGAPDELRRGLIAESQLFFEGWFLCDFLFQNGRTAVDLFLEREGARLRSGERRYLERARLAHLRPYEVVGIKPGERLDLLDLWTGQRLQVEERLATQQLAQWDVLAARILLGAGDRPVIDGSAYLYPVDARGSGGGMVGGVGWREEGGGGAEEGEVVLGVEGVGEEGGRGGGGGGGGLLRGGGRGGGG